MRLEVGAVEATLAAGEALRISTSLKNTSSRPLYLLPCAGTALFRLERREADVWQGIYNPGCDYALRAPVVIQAGATYTDVASIPVDVTLTPGAYRVQLAVYRADVTRISDLATPSEYLIPEAQRTSPSFEVPLQ